jgi:hypothetical protein
MNTESSEAAPKKKSLFSIPFLVIGGLLIAALIPWGDVDGDGSVDVGYLGKLVMLKVMTGEENAKVGKPTLGEVPDYALPAAKTGL